MSGTSDKSRGVAFVLAALLGWAGAHRFYVGKVGTGLLMLCTLGGLGVWYLYDVIVIASGGFRDADHRRLIHWDPDAGGQSAEITHEVLDELDALRREVGELAERVDFTERLLLQSNPVEQRDR